MITCHQIKKCLDNFLYPWYNSIYQEENKYIIKLNKKETYG
jgi:hypothetical protein